MNFDSVMHHMNIILLYIKVGLKTYIMQKLYIYIYILYNMYASIIGIIV